VTSPPDPRPAEEPSALGSLIPTKNAPALVGYYLAVFSLIPGVGYPLGLAAFPLGIVGLRKIARQPGLPGRVHAWVAILVGGLSILGHTTALVLMLTARR
jgi:hypothetical protein